MTQTANRRRKVVMPSGIRKKFAAALCMLLVAAIMMVGSTYAWFTLSTAPEVTGITTNIGANGNLEIALLNDTSFNLWSNDLGIVSSTNDSMVNGNIAAANETWGNLVDLSLATYGLDKMILNPAAVNFASTETAGSYYITGGMNSLLLAPRYGSDGRVIDVTQGTVAGKYADSHFTEGTSIGGVRVIGVSSGVTLRVTAYRQAVSAIATYMNLAKSKARSSLVDNGQQLASALVSYSANNGYEFSAADVNAVKNVLSQLNQANQAIADGIRQASLAYALSSANTTELSDSEVSALQANIGAVAVDANGAALEEYLDVELPASIKGNDGVIAKYLAIASNITTAQSAVSGDTMAFEDLGRLVDKNNALINGIDGSTLTTDDIGKLATQIAKDGQAIVTMLEGSGIYADIAELVGDYSASGLLITVTVSGIELEDFPATMNTSVVGNGTALLAGISLPAEYSSNSGAAKTIDDPYGYVIDLGFRTNAAGSDLLLDVDGSQRVYTDEINVSTQGSGSYLEFTSDDLEKFTLEDIEALMSAIRVVFVTPKTDSTGYDILGVAAVDINVTTNNVTGVHTVTKGETVQESVDTVRASLALYNYTVSEITEGKEYQLVKGTQKVDVVEGTGEEPATTTPNYVITSLEQNKAKKVSVLVYLDGDIVDNTFVTNAKTSMSGKLNLQFKSSAELKPMDVTSMRNASESGVTVVSITKGKLSMGVAYIKTTDVYTTALNTDVAERTQEQIDLLAAVTAAETVIANNDATDADLLAAAQGLATAFGTNPF